MDKPEQVCTSTKQLSVILDDKFEKEDLNRAMENQYQHLKEVQCNKFAKIITEIQRFF